MVWSMMDINGFNWSMMVSHVFLMVSQWSMVNNGYLWFVMVILGVPTGQLVVNNDKGDGQLMVNGQ